MTRSADDPVTFAALSLGGGLAAFAISEIATRNDPIARSSQRSPTEHPLRGLSKRFDPVFDRHRGPIPIEYLRALASRESDLNPREARGPAWGLCQIVESVRLDYNRRHGARVARRDLFDPDVNVAICCWALQTIARSYQRNHPRVPNLQPGWTNPSFLELLTFGWNAGYSELHGVGCVARFLEARGTTDITIETIAQYAAQAGATRNLSRLDKLRWCRGVVALYRRERALANEAPQTQP